MILLNEIFAQSREDAKGTSANHHINGGPCWARTSDPLIMSQML